jgi:hypothetical protein
MIPRSVDPGTARRRRVTLVRAVDFYFGVCFGASWLTFLFCKVTYPAANFLFLKKFLFLFDEAKCINTFRRVEV